MAGLRNIRNTNAFKFILQVFILSQKHIMGVKKVVWCGLDVVWGGLVVVWGVLGWFGVFPRTDITVCCILTSTCASGNYVEFPVLIFYPKI